MLTGGYSILLIACRRVQDLFDRAVVRHGACLRHAVGIDKDFIRQHVCRRGGRGGDVLIVFRDRADGHTGQAVIALIWCDGLLLLRRRDGFGLQVVVAAAGDALDRAGAVVISRGDGVGFALLDLRVNRALIFDGCSLVGQRAELVRARGESEADEPCAQLVPRSL